MPFRAVALKPLDWAVSATGLLSLIALFLPWFGVSVAGFNATVSGWHTSYGWFGSVLVVVAAAWYVLMRGGAALPPLPVSGLAGALGTSAVGLLIVVVRWATLPRYGHLGQNINYGGRPGIWIAAVVAAVQVGVLALLFSRAGEPPPWKSSGGRHS